MKTPEYFIRQWRRLDNVLSASPRVSGVSSGLENDLDPNAWCSIAHCVEVGETSVTVGLRLPEPNARQVRAEVSGQTLAVSVLRSGENPSTATLEGFFRRAIHVPVALTGTCSHHFEGPFLVVVMDRELEKSGVTRPGTEKSTKNGKAPGRKQIGGSRDHRPRGRPGKTRDTFSGEKAARPAG